LLVTSSKNVGVVKIKRAGVDVAGVTSGYDICRFSIKHNFANIPQQQSPIISACEIYQYINYIEHCEILLVRLVYLKYNRMHEHHNLHNYLSS